MGTEPRPASLARDGTGRVDRRRWPIILLPGILGSRLQFAGSSSHFWDPDSTANLFGLAMSRRETLRRRLDPTLAGMQVSNRPSHADFPSEPGVYVPDPMGGGTWVPGPPIQRYIDRGWAGPIWGYYGDGLLHIERHVAAVGGVVYAFGYDWRQSNEFNGLRLTRFIEDVVRDRDGHRYKPVVVTHSMGGLVTRSCISQGGDAVISAVIHTFMPTFGAPEAYAKFRRGEPSELRRIVGDEAHIVIQVTCGLTGGFELMPTNRYGRECDGQWWTGVHSHAGGSQPIPTPDLTGDPWENLYKDRYLGVRGVARIDRTDIGRGQGIDLSTPLGRTISARMLANVDQAKRFHTEVLSGGGLGFHPNMYNLAGDQTANTTVGAHMAMMSSAGPSITVTYVTDRRQSDRGDATVPFVSAEVPRNHGALRHEVVTGVDHGTAINNPTALAVICRLIDDARSHLVTF